MERMTLWWRLRSMLGATLAGLGIQRSSGPAYRPVWIVKGPFWKRWWYRLRPPAPPADYVPVGPPPWAGPPESEIGVGVPVSQVIHSSQDLVVALTDLTAYSNGFAFRIAVRSRTSMDARFFGFGPHRTTDVITLEVRLADGRAGRGGTGAPGDEVMEYYHQASEGGEPAVPAGPIVGTSGGGGGGKRWDFQWWVWPLPPDGPVTVTLGWHAKQITAAVEIDGTAIRQAGNSSKDVWDGG